MTHLAFALVAAGVLWVLFQVFKATQHCSYCGNEWGKHDDGCPYDY